MILATRPTAFVLVAAVLGAVVAFATMRAAGPQSAPASKSSAPSARTTAALRPSPARTLDPSRAPAAAAPVPAAASAVATAPATHGSASTAALGVLASPEDLRRAELDCDRKKLPEACESVARSLETGSAGTRDAARAGKLRRIALTLYVKQCETDRAFSCSRLAEMYDQGEIVQKNPKNAAALRARVIELCRVRPDQLGCEPAK